MRLHSTTARVMCALGCISAIAMAAQPRGGNHRTIKDPVSRSAGLTDARVRVRTPTGVLVIYDAPTTAARGNVTSFLAYWADLPTAAIYVFDETLTDRQDLSHALDALAQNFDSGVIDELRELAPDLIAIATRSKQRREVSTWIPATRENVFRVMGASEGAIGATSAGEGGDDGPVLCCPIWDPCCVTSNSTGTETLLEPEFMDALTLFEAGTQSAACCPGGGGGGGGGCLPSHCVDDNPCTTDYCGPTQCLHTTISDPCCDGSLSDALGSMDEGLSVYVEAEDVSLQFEIEEPVIEESGVSTTVRAFDSTGQARTGTASVECGNGGGTTAVTIDVTNDNGGGTFNQRWTLIMDAWVDGDTIHFFGDLEHESIPANAAGAGVDEGVGGVASVIVYQGGWSYSDATGPLEAAGSEPGFYDTAADMFNVVAASNAATAQALSIATTLQMIANCIAMKINFLRDLSMAWSTPTTCSGPTVRSSCGANGEELPCVDSLSQMCAMVGNIPNVSVGFKKCMKGRCGCGGSKHRRASVACDDQDSCGPCGDALGCNLYGSQTWYCSPTGWACPCIKVVFHEMTHACGAIHNLQFWLNGRVCNDTDPACKIGDWFQDEAEEAGIPNCLPPVGQ